MDATIESKLEAIEDAYLPAYGEGATLATQAVTAIAKLVGMWESNGDVFDSRCGMEGCNDVSSYANWLVEEIGGEVPGIRRALWRVVDVGGDEAAYDEVMEELVRLLVDVIGPLLARWARIPARGSVYRAWGPFSCEVDYYDEWGDGECEYA